ncbi:MAG: branched-chain amino acid ABC transporter permease [Chloroflexi bacterium]|nr:MAG: branched-chain amino acid ABC transporter permease [Chloroflexota bacterium]
MRRIDWRWILTGGALLIALSAPLLLSGYPYWLHVAIVAYFYAILASSWSLLAGYAGQFSFAHMAFMAIGAYGSGLMGKYLGTTPVVGIVASTILAGFVGLIIGTLCLRLRGAYLALFTIAFSEVLRLTLNAELKITGGPNGLSLEPLLATTSRVPYYYLMLILLLASLGFMYWLAGSRFGLFFRSIREDEEAAAAMGVHIVRYKIAAFVITAMIAGLAGGVEAHYIGLVTPNILILGQMSIVIAMAVIGGIESLVGAAIGAILVQFSLELLREVGNWRLVAFGLLLMLTLRFARNGLIYPLIDRLVLQQAREAVIVGRAQKAKQVGEQA